MRLLELIIKLGALLLIEQANRDWTQNRCFVSGKARNHGSRVKVGGREVQAFPPSRAQSLLQMNQPWTLKGNNP